MRWIDCTVLVACVLPCLALGLAASDDDLGEWVTEGRWSRGPLAVAPTPQKQVERARKLAEIGDSRQAADQYKRLANVFSESDLAEEGLILSSKYYLAAGDFTAAREQLDELRRRYANPSYLDAIGEVEIRLGRGFLEGKGEGGTYLLKSRIRKATAIFQRLLNSDPEGRWADDAMLGLGQCSETLFDYDAAIKYYKDLLEKYPRSELRATAESRIATCINKREPQPEYTESDTEEARRRIQQARDEALAEDVDIDLVALEENEKVLADRQARKRYEQAQFYMKNAKYRAAEVYFELVKTRYPSSEWAKKSADELIKLRQR
jgi:outer membrane protein assembly factor BamD (BamD/ComL family)